MSKISNIKHQTLGQPKLSIIVPVYNVEQYLRKCVDSLLNQDYEDYEIILVDDGSTDSCPAICDEYALTHYTLNGTQIKVIHQPNAGLSAARNSGIRIAKGEYLCFVDSDDFWQTNVLAGLMAQVERDKLEILRFKYQNVNEQYEEFNPYKQDHRLENDYSSIPTDGATFLDTRMNYQCYAVMYILRRELVPEFTEGIHFEDVEWFPRMMMRVKRVASTDTIVYNYLIRLGSITQVQGNEGKIRKNLEDELTIIGRYSKYRKQYPKCIWLHEMQSNLVAGVIANIAQYFYSERKDFIVRLKLFDVFPLMVATKLGRTYLRKARLINISPRLAVILLHLKNGM